MWNTDTRKSGLFSLKPFCLIFLAFLLIAGSFISPLWFCVFIFSFGTVLIIVSLYCFPCGICVLHYFFPYHLHSLGAINYKNCFNYTRKKPYDPVHSHRTYWNDLRFHASKGPIKIPHRNIHTCLYYKLKRLFPLPLSAFA